MVMFGLQFLRQYCSIAEPPAWPESLHVLCASDRSTEQRHPRYHDFGQDSYAPVRYGWLSQSKSM